MGDRIVVRYLTADHDVFLNRLARGFAQNQMQLFSRVPVVDGVVELPGRGEWTAVQRKDLIPGDSAAPGGAGGKLNLERSGRNLIGMTHGPDDIRHVVGLVQRRECEQNG